jgi:hypothetical protein
VTGKSYLGFLVLAFTTLACVRINLSAPPLAQTVPTVIPPSAATPRPAPLPTLVVAPLPTPIFVAPALPPCRLPNLEKDEHMAASGSYTETERTASTPMLCHLERDSCGYNRLVGLLDASIVFKREEDPPYDTEDILMHPAMLLPLERLRKLVEAEWQGVFELRVTDAYDSLLSHDPPESEPSRRYSLHYEGRAIDMTTWPVDQSRYGRLCALAHCAGFDWVHNEGSHCHASIRADSLCTQCAH